MKLLRSTMILMLVLGMALMVAACSGGNSPVNPGSANMPDTFGTTVDEGRNVIAAYEATIDPVAQTFTIEPTERVGSFHFPLTNSYPNVVKVVSFNFGPPFTANISLTHPYPNSGIKGYDPRVIAILPANSGVSMGYNGLSVLANHSVLLQPDGYTKLMDKTALAGNANPFVAYFKEKSFREWSSTPPNHTETKTWTMDINGFGGALQFFLVVDVSTNFPAPPTPVTDNCPEPAEIVTSTVGPMQPAAGSQATIEVKILDWQSASGTTVKCEAPALTNNINSLVYAGPGGTNQYIFSGTLTNQKAAPEGDYFYLIEAKDTATGIALYDEFKLTVSAGGTQGAWTLDPDRDNVDTTLWTQPAFAGTDIAVIDGSNTDWNGVVMYDEFSQIVKADLNLTDGNIYGYAYLPSNDKGTHPAPDTQMLAGRLDGADANGFVFRTFVDENITLGPAGNGKYQREDCVIIISMPNADPFLEALTGIYLTLNDNTNTTEYNEANELLAGADVWDEADTGLGTNPLSIFWKGTQILDVDTSSYNPIGAMGGLADPYFDGAAFVVDWGIWGVTYPPFSEIVGMDGSQDQSFPWMFWAIGKDIFVNQVAWYTKDTLSYVDAYTPTDAAAKILDVQLIPLQNPPLVIETKTQLNDWVAVLLDNKTIEIFDPTMPLGELVSTVDMSGITGTPSYFDIDNKNADIFVSHNDGVIQYVSVFTIH